MQPIKLSEEIKIMNSKWKKRKIRRILAIFLCLMIIWHHVMVSIEKRTYKDQYPGQLVSINSHNVHAYIRGEGETTIVFITGSGTPNAYTDFYYLQQELGKNAVTVSYDQPGYGWSEDIDEEKKIDLLTSDLNLLLEKLELKKPYILAAHSLGGLEAIRYAQLYPENVSKIVFLDSGSPEFYEKDSIIKSYAINRTSAGLRNLGILRLLGLFDVYLPMGGESARYNKLPADLKKIDKAFYYRMLGSSSNLGNIKLMNENAKQVLNNGKLKDIPLLVLSYDSGDNWQKVQNELAGWSSKSKQIMIPDSEHYLYWTNTEEVLDTIKTFIENDTNQ
ncbi:alpha/beta fold hydrolase [Anaerosporobacter sp.]